MCPTRFVVPILLALSLLRSVGAKADESTGDAPSAAPKDLKQLATVTLAGPFADIEAYCATLRDEQPSAHCSLEPPLTEPASRPRATGTLTGVRPFDRIAVIEVASDRSNNEWAIGLHSAAGWWVDEAVYLSVDGRGRGLPAVLDAHWEAGQWGPRVRIRRARSWWKKEESLARSFEDDYQCSGAIILCGQDAAGKLGCSEELMLAVTASSCSHDEKPTPIWPQWQRWSFRLEPEPIGRAAWRLTPHGSSAGVLGKNAPTGLKADVANILARRGIVVQLPY